MQPFRTFLRVGTEGCPNLYLSTRINMKEYNCYVGITSYPPVSKLISGRHFKHSFPEGDNYE